MENIKNFSFQRERIVDLNEVQFVGILELNLAFYYDRSSIQKKPVPSKQIHKWKSNFRNLSQQKSIKL